MRIKAGTSCIFHELQYKIYAVVIYCTVCKLVAVLSICSRYYTVTETTIMLNGKILFWMLQAKNIVLTRENINWKLSKSSYIQRKTDLQISVRDIMFMMKNFMLLDFEKQSFKLQHKKNAKLKPSRWFEIAV